MPLFMPPVSVNLSTNISSMVTPFFLYVKVHVFSLARTTQCVYNIYDLI